MGSLSWQISIFWKRNFNQKRLQKEYQSERVANTTREIWRGVKLSTRFFPFYCPFSDLSNLVCILLVFYGGLFRHAEQIRVFPELFGLQLLDVLCCSTVLDNFCFLTTCCNRFLNPLSRTRIRHIQHCRDWTFEHSFTFCQPLSMYSKVYMV